MLKACRPGTLAPLYILGLLNQPVPAPRSILHPTLPGRALPPLDIAYGASVSGDRRLGERPISRSAQATGSAGRPLESGRDR